MFSMNNSVRLTGRLGQDPQIRTLENGRKVANFSLATNDFYKTEKGEKVENTIWHRIVAWGAKAELVEKYLTKGKEISLEGKLTNRSYDTKDGSPRTVTEIVLNEMKFLSGGTTS